MLLFQISVFIAATSSFEPDPHREIDLIACVKGTSKGCTRSGVRIKTAPAKGVGTEGTNNLVDLGEKMGADPSSRSTSPP